ncbi:MAG: sensory box/GGDEF family protein [Paenibacillus sp.]|nr:sensory box/GGDEF family protein [Paenibacillus sp.]
MAGLFLYVKYRINVRTDLWAWMKLRVLSGVICGATGLALSLLFFYKVSAIKEAVAHDQMIALMAGIWFIVFVMIEQWLANGIRKTSNGVSANRAVFSQKQAWPGSPEHLDLPEPTSSENSTDSAKRKVYIENILPEAFGRGEFSIHYQPQYETATGQIRCFEALLRWNHPGYGEVSPAEFIPAAESSGFIIQLGEWVIREACRKNKELQTGGFTESVMSVNVSALQLHDVGFTGRVRGILEDTRMEAQYLEIELTESTLVQCFDTSVRILEEMGEMGVRIALDDFGTGYSSLNYLKQLPIHNVKIDRSFMQNLCSDSKGKVIVEAIISLIHKLGLGVVAEGIETKEQLDCVKSFGCECVQGFLLSRPLKELDIASIVEQNRVLRKHA